MLMLQGMEKAFGECANQIVNKYDIKVSVDKITDVICEFGNEFTKGYWLTSLQIINTSASFKSTNIKEELKTSIRQALENIWSDLTPDKLEHYGKVMDQTFDL